MTTTTYGARGLEMIKTWPGTRLLDRPSGLCLLLCQVLWPPRVFVTAHRTSSSHCPPVPAPVYRLSSSPLFYSDFFIGFIRNDGLWGPGRNDFSLPSAA